MCDDDDDDDAVSVIMLCNTRHNMYNDIHTLVYFWANTHPQLGAANINVLAGLNPILPLKDKRQFFPPPTLDCSLFPIYLYVSMWNSLPRLILVMPSARPCDIMHCSNVIIAVVLLIDI